MKAFLIERHGGSGAGWTTAAKIGTAAAAATVTIATSRLLPADARGELAAAIAAAVLLGSALSLSLWLGTSIELRSRPSIGHATRRFAVIYPVLIGVVLIPATVLVLGGFDDSIWPWTALAATALTSYSLLQGLPVGEGNMRGYAVAELIRGWPGAAACIAAAAITGDPKLAVAAWGCGAVAGAAYLVATSDRSRETTEIRAYLRLVGPQSIRAHGGNVLGLLAIRLDLVLLVSISSAAEVAYYSLAIAFAEVLWIFSSAQGVAHLSELVRSDPIKARALTARAIRRVIAVVVPVAVLIGASAGWLVPTVVGDGYTQAVAPLRLALIAATLFALVHVLGPYVAAGLHRPWLITVNGVAMLSVNVALLLWLAPTKGALGAAIASVAAYAISAAMYLYLLCRPPPLRPSMSTGSPPQGKMAAPEITA